MSLPAELGPLHLVDRIGAGGFGEVWRARHVGGMLAAVKVVTAPEARSGDASDLHEEALAAASLSHPGIVTVLGYGRIEGGHLRGAPWLAMELAEGGTSRPGPHPWAEVRHLLELLLEALAHSHARGLLHGDVKASNVVLGGRTPGPKLTDFGIARRLGHPDRSTAVQPAAGTAAYMAPELWTSSPKDVGPWTDLYALGCLAWLLLTGRVPFDRTSSAALAHAHLREPLGPLRTPGALPEGAGRWLTSLLRKDPARRCASAAQALAGLRCLPAPEPRDLAHLFSQTDPRPATRADTFDWNTNDGASSTAHQTTAPHLPHPAMPPVDEVSRQIPWVPDLHARSKATVVPPPHLVGAGLPLFGVRQPPLVGRAAHEAQLWATLREVASTGAPACVVLLGVPGVGCTRLARALVQGALTQGVSMAAVATTGREASDGLGAMLARDLDAVGLGGDVLRARIDQAIRHHTARWSPGEVDALRQVVAPTEPLDGALKLGGRRDRFATVLRYSDRARRAGPAVLVLDDAHQSEESVAFAEYVLEQRTPTLLLLTMDEAALSEDEALRARVDRLTDHPSVARMRVPQLTDDALRQVLRYHVRLDPPVAADVVTRASGNPLYALQLLADALAAGDLSWTDDGRHATGTLSTAPTQAAVWSRRLDRWWTDADAPARRAASAAAALGQRLVLPEWTRVCALLEADAPADVLPGLIEGLLVRRDRDRVSWTHPALRELLLERLADTPELETAHLACAEALAEATDAGSLERRARHLLDGGRPALAVEPLEAVTAHLVDQGEPGRQARACALYGRALELAGVPRSDPAWGDLTTRAVLQLVMDHRLDEAERVLSRAADEQGGADPIVVARVLEARGEVDAAVDTLRSMEAPPPRLVELLLRQGAVDRALSVAEAVVARDGSSRAWAALAHVHVTRGDAGQGIAASERAAELARADGNRANLQDALNLLGESARLAGDLARAEGCYLAALRTFEGTERGPSRLLYLNLALVALLRGHWPDAEAWARRMVRDQSDRLRWIEPLGQLALAAAVARQGRRSEARRLWEQWAKPALAIGAAKSDILVCVEVLLDADLDAELTHELRCLLDAP